MLVKPLNYLEMNIHRYVVLIGLLFVVGATRHTVEEPSNTRTQYEHCRAKLFTTYPKEINKNKWRRCMGTKSG